MKIKSQEVILAELGKKIRLIREEKGLTQEDFDDNSQLSIATRPFQQIEYGRANAKIYTLYKIAQRLGVKVKDLIDF